jgi:hypothetical protein
MASQNAVPKKKNSTNVILAVPKPTVAAALGSTPEAHTMKNSTGYYPPCIETWSKNVIPCDMHQWGHPSS